MVMNIIFINSNIFFFKIKGSKKTRGHNFTRVKKQSRWRCSKVFIFPENDACLELIINRVCRYTLVVLICAIIE